MNENQGRTNKDLHEAAKMCGWSMAVIVIWILGSILASIIEKI